MSPCLFFFFLPTVWGRFFDNDWQGTYLWVQENATKSRFIISYFLSWFHPMSLGYPLLGSWSLKYGFHLLGWALSQISYWHISFLPPLPYLARRTLLYIKNFMVGGLVFMIIFWYSAVYLPVLKVLEPRYEGFMWALAHLLHVQWFVWVLSSAMGSYCHIRERNICVGNILGCLEVPMNLL